MRRFDDFHPGVVFIYYLAVIVPVMFMMNLEGALAAFVLGIVRLSFMRKKIPWGTLFFSGVIIAIMGIVNGMVSHAGATELFFINGKAITLEAIQYGLISGLMLAAALVWFMIFSGAMTGEKITAIFRRMPKLGLIISMILRLVPMYVARYREVSAATKVNPDRKNSIKVMSSVFTYALESSTGMAQSMQYRGYDVTKKRYSRYRMGQRDYFLLAIVIVMQGMYACSGIANTVLRCVFMAIPLIWEGKECMKWQFMKKKIS